MTRTIELAAKTALLVGISAAMIFIAEMTLRLAGIAYPSWYRPDEILGYALRPHAAGWHRDESRTFVQISSQGFRDMEHALAKPQGTLRIAVLGDSFTEAMQVEQHEAFWSVIKEELVECTDKPIEVLNFGVGGYGTAQELLMLRERALAFDPDIVVLAFFTSNDVRNNSRVLEGNPLRSYYTLSGTTLLLDDAFRREPEFQRRSTPWYSLWTAILNRSRILQGTALAKRTVEGFLHARMAGKPIQWEHNPPLPTEQGVEWNEPGIETWTFLPPATEITREAWAVTERLVTQIQEDVVAHGARFAVIVFSSGIGVHPDMPLRHRFQVQIGASNLMYGEERIADLGAKSGFPVLPLTPPLRAFAEENSVFLHGSDATGKGHWNVEGHRLVGELTSTFLCEKFAEDIFSTP
ncbi:hypothetical protein COU80_05795 [Candidatus Peregrinibacteria bacterium CG10_big_fil_rev_8_21_14_0_10_55_24]|nr:MAG: hypothetical protein COU80_05795 [Candidatus Peregrinibacteria bacterium CG10_big_fil_rev_8_21_14_0_10_55_24]